MIKTIGQFPFPVLGAITEFTCDADYLLDDSAFSNKTNQIAKKEDVVRLATYLNFGVVNHPVHGIFRF